MKQQEEQKQSVLGLVICSQCKQLVAARALSEHFWDEHPLIAKKIFIQRKLVTIKIKALERLTFEGMIGYKETTL